MQRQFNHVFIDKILREFTDRLKLFKAIYWLIKNESNVQTIHRQIESRLDRKFSDSPPANLTFKRLFYGISSPDLNFETIHLNITFWRTYLRQLTDRFKILETSF